MLSYLRKKMKTIMIGVAVLFAASMFYGIGYRGLKGMKEAPQKGSIATIDGKEIDHKRFSQAIKKLMSQEKGLTKPETVLFYQTVAVQQTIDFTLMLKDAKRHFGVSGQEIDEALDQIMQASKIPNRDALKNAVQGTGQDFSAFKDGIRDEILVAKMVNKVKTDVVITPDDLREVRARHILIMPRSADQKGDTDARMKAEELLSRIKNGEKFEALAKEYSDDSGSAKKGGDLGYFTTGSMVPEFEKAAFALKPGEVSDIVKTPYGYHIIKMEDTRLRKSKGKDLNEEVLADKQDQALKKWMFDLKQKAKIEINDPLMQAYSLYVSGNLNQAISAYNQASLDDPSNPYIHLFLGDAYLKTGNAEFAALEYGKASQFSGADSNILIALGGAYRGMKKNKDALENYRRASMIAGDDKEIHKELKSIFESMGAKTDAANERAELARIDKKEKFENEIKQKLGQ